MIARSGGLARRPVAWYRAGTMRMTDSGGISEYGEIGGGR
jgi:hypothetical protein